MNKLSPDPLHGKTLQAIVEFLVERYGWQDLGRRVKIKCFQVNPSIKSSLTFLRRTPWAREQVEVLYIGTLRNRQNNIAGVAVVLEKENQILLTLRKAGDNVGTYELPAGHVEAGETTSVTAKREVLEETGLIIDALKSLATFGVTELFVANIVGGELSNREPYAHESVAWYERDNLPASLGPSARYYMDILIQS